MQMRVHFPGGKKVFADYNGFTIETDQPAMGGGDGTAPAPFDLFLASIGTCAGVYILGFCQQRGLPAEGIELSQSLDFDPHSRLISNINIDIKVPADFPEKYHDALIKSAELCAVKRHLDNPPSFRVQTVVTATAQ
jgi:putative redox protein